MSSLAHTIPRGGYACHLPGLAQGQDWGWVHKTGNSISLLAHWRFKKNGVISALGLWCLIISCFCCKRKMLYSRHCKKRVLKLLQRNHWAQLKTEIWKLSIILICLLGACVPFAFLSVPAHSSHTGKLVCLCKTSWCLVPHQLALLDKSPCVICLQISDQHLLILPLPPLQDVWRKQVFHLLWLWLPPQSSVTFPKAAPLWFLAAPISDSPQVICSQQMCL